MFNTVNDVYRYNTPGSDVITILMQRNINSQNHQMNTSQMWRSLNSNLTTSNVFNRLEIRQMSWALCCRIRIRGVCSTTDFIWVQTGFFLLFNLSHELQLLNVQHNFCSVMRYTVLIWTLILVTSGNNILLQSFNWPKPVHYVPSIKINASICVRRILKVKICIRRMQILPASSHHYITCRQIMNSLLLLSRSTQHFAIH